MLMVNHSGFPNRLCHHFVHWGSPVERGDFRQVGTRQKGDLCCLISSDCHGRVKNFPGWGQVKSFNGFIYCCMAQEDFEKPSHGN